MRKGEVYTFGFRGFPDVQGGIEAHAENLTPLLVKLGYRVTACVRTPYIASNSDRTWKGVRLLRLWTVRNTYLETLLHSLVCAVVAGIRRPEIVHVHGIGSALVVPLLRLLGLRVIVTHHGEDYNREKWGWTARMALKAGEMAGMRFAHKRIVISRGIERLVASRYGCASALISNGVVFHDLPSSCDKVLELGLTPGRYVLTVGRLVPEKRQLDLLHAFIAAKLHEWHLVIVGNVDHESKYGSSLIAEARLIDNVIMAGYQSGETLRQLYAHAGLFVLPSSHEGLPIVLLEALSFGLPLLVSNIPANMEVVSDPSHVFRVGDEGELALKLAELTHLNQDPQIRELVRRQCASRYDWTEIASKTSAAYRELAKPHSHTLKSERLRSRPRWAARWSSVFNSAEIGGNRHRDKSRRANER